MFNPRFPERGIFLLKDEMGQSYIRLKLEENINFLPLNCYRNVLLGMGGETMVGNIVSHLSLDDWAEMNRARIWSRGTHQFLNPVSPDRTSFDPIEEIIA